MTVYISVVQNNPGLSNAFATKQEAVNWIESYLEDYTILGDCYYLGYGKSGNPSGTGDVRAWIVSREITYDPFGDE